MSLFEQKVYEVMLQAECELLRRKAEIEDLRYKYMKAVFSSNNFLAIEFKGRLDVATENYNGLEQEIHDCKRSLGII